MGTKTKFNKYLSKLEGYCDWKKLNVYLSEKTEYFTAPASSRYHHAYPGGLLEHSIEVLEWTMKIDEALSLNCGEQNIILSSLFHDLGKAEPGYYSMDFNKSDVLYQHIGETKYKKTNPKPHHLLSIEMLEQAEIEFNEIVREAILGHDGLFTEEGSKILRSKYHPLTLILHTADMLSARKE